MPQPATSPNVAIQSYREERDAAVRAARQAARLIRMRAGEVETDEVREKGVHDLVTRTDEEAQALIVDCLRGAFPGYDVLAEEGAPRDRQAVADGRRWIIDPIDGTTNFTHGVPPFAVSIALQHGRDVVVGVVLDVAAGELFTAVRGGGLYVNGGPAQVSTADTLEASLVATGFPYRMFDDLEIYLKVLERFLRASRGVRRQGSAVVDLARVACGRFGGSFSAGLSPWDVAAGRLLVEEGGGRVTDFGGAGELVFEGQVLATNGRLHAPMMELLAPLRDVGR